MLDITAAAVQHLQACNVKLKDDKVIFQPYVSSFSLFYHLFH